MGEKLIAFRDSKGRIGLIDEFCAHRGVSLWFGENEECGLRCHYHGWKYDVTGQCIDLPSEPEESRLPQEHQTEILSLHREGRDHLGLYGPARIAAAAAGAGMDRGRSPQQRFVSKRLQECNYLQAMEGGIDSSHVSWLHGTELNKDPLFKGSKGNEYNEKDRMPHFEVEEFSGGLLIGARRNAEAGKYYWRITPWIMPWYTIIPPRAGHPLGAHAWVPIDDETCWAWSINYHPKRALTKAEVVGHAGRRGHPRQIRARHLHPARQQGEQLSDGPRGAAARP